MNKTKKRLLHFVIAMCLVVLGALVMAKLTASKPALRKLKPAAPVPMARITRVKTGPQPVYISGEGTVRPVQEINLVPQVDGKVIYVSPDLVNGGEFRKGNVLLRIDPADYQLAVTIAEAKVKDSESNLKLAQEESAAAREEWRMLSPGRSESEMEPPPLVAREPQLAAAQAKLAADRADLIKTRLYLERTELVAPFDGRVSQENVDIGQYVSPGQSLATLYSIKAAEIVIPLEDKALFWFCVPGFTPGDGPGSSATVLASIAGQRLSWVGEVVRAEGKLDESTRMINVVVKVENPYAKKPPLAMGLFVTVEIKGRTLPHAAIVPRAALHQDNVIWVVDNDSLLHFRKVDVARVHGDVVFVKAGLKDGERVVVSPLKAVTDGMAVRSVLVKEGSS